MSADTIASLVGLLATLIEQLIVALRDHPTATVPEVDAEIARLKAALRRLEQAEDALPRG